MTWGVLGVLFQMLLLPMLHQLIFELPTLFKLAATSRIWHITTFQGTYATTACTYFHLQLPMLCELQLLQLPTCL